MLLGYDWLHAHNPRIDWRKGLISLPSSAAEFVATQPKRGTKECAFLLPAESLEKMLQNPKARAGMRIWSIHGSPRENQSRPARLTAVSTPTAYRCRDLEVYAVLDRYLKSECYSVDACIEAALVSLGANKVLSA